MCNVIRNSSDNHPYLVMAGSAPPSAMIATTRGISLISEVDTDVLQLAWVARQPAEDVAPDTVAGTLGCGRGSFSNIP